MRVLITGGTGFVGQALCPRLADAGHEVVILTRQPNPRLPAGVAHAVTDLRDLDARQFGAVINLAGAPIGDARWTDARKKLLLESRVATTARLVEWMGSAARPPGVLVSASAVGYYGEQGDRPITEDTAPTPGFTHELCAAWEREAGKATALGVRVCTMRIGVVLDRDGGALAKMLPAFRAGAGGRLGSGRHYFPWIHREDAAEACRWLLENPQSRGAYNLSAPNPVTNAEFTRALGRALGRPTVLPMPEAALKLLFGEMSELLLVSDRMLPKRLLDEGFRFRYPDLGDALAAIFPRRA
ncbi:MAG: TIGR01777 family protein [Gammaproteobacteria bacterium]|nr:TIGR01777 family protein [Gammaproteobacteria bacterium]